MTFFRSLRRLLAVNHYQQRQAERNDSLTLVAQAGKPQAAGLRSSRIDLDRRVVPSLRRKA